MSRNWGTQRETKLSGAWLSPVMCGSTAATEVSFVWGRNDAQWILGWTKRKWEYRKAKGWRGDSTDCGYSTGGWSGREATRKDWQVEAVRDRGTEVPASEGEFQGWWVSLWDQGRQLYLLVLVIPLLLPSAGGQRKMFCLFVFTSWKEGLIVWKSMCLARSRWSTHKCVLIGLLAAIAELSSWARALQLL